MGRNNNNMMIKIYSSSVEPDLGFVETTDETLDMEDKLYYEFHEDGPNDLVEIAREANLSGFIWISDYMSKVVTEDNSWAYVPC